MRNVDTAGNSESESTDWAATQSKNFFQLGETICEGVPEHPV